MSHHSLACPLRRCCIPPLLAAAPSCYSSSVLLTGVTLCYPLLSVILFVTFVLSLISCLHFRPFLMPSLILWILWFDCIFHLLGFEVTSQTNMFRQLQYYVYLCKHAGSQWPYYLFQLPLNSVHCTENNKTPTQQITIVPHNGLPVTVTLVSLARLHILGLFLISSSSLRSFFLFFL